MKNNWRKKRKGNKEWVTGDIFELYFLYTRYRYKNPDKTILTVS